MNNLSPLTLADVISVRFLDSGEQGLTQSQVKDALKSLVSTFLSDAEWTQQREACLTQLVEQGWLSLAGKNRYQMTPTGKVQTLKTIGLAEQPQRIQWKRLKNIYLVARALDLPAPQDEKQRQRIGEADGLRGSILRHHFQLPIPPFPTLTIARDALLWQHFTDPTFAAQLPSHRSTLLGKPFNQGSVMGFLLNDLLGTSGLEWKKALNQLVTKVAQAKRTDPDELRYAVIRNALIEKPPVPTPVPLPSLTLPPPPSATTFAEKVCQAAKRSPTGRFGDRKVFISHVWKQLQQDHPDSRLSLEEFKSQLLQAHREGSLELSRADMAHALDQTDVAQSEIQFLSATFHFVTLD